MQRLILASTSPFRRELLDRFGLPFEVVAPRTDETPGLGEPPAALAQRLALAKARAVAAAAADALVIGSDQVASGAGQIFGKPGTIARAVTQLRAMRGREIVFHTAVAVVDGASGDAREFIDATRVGFRDYADDEIDRYLAREPDAIRCAGSAKAEALGTTLLDYIRGDDPTALIGLPLIGLARLLRGFGLQIP